MSMSSPARRAVIAGLLSLVALAPARTQEPASAQVPAVPAQPPAPQQPVFRTGVSVVRVDVSVTGKGQRPVEDLVAEDFDVEEDGVPQRVDTAQFVKRDGRRSAGDQDALEIRSQEHAEAEAARDDVRVFALFLDDYHIDRRPNITVPMRDALVNFVNKLGPADLAAIMEPLTPLSSLKFTRDTEDLRRWIKKFEGRQGELFPIKSPLEEAQYQSQNVRMVRAEVTISALTALVTRLGRLREGRKSVIYVSQGPFTFFGYDGNIESRMTELLEAASRGNVNISVFDPRGLGGEGFGSRDTLYRLAGDTGGRTIINTNNFDEALQHVVEDESAFYLLSYTPSRTEDDGKFHKIKVKVKRPGASIIARRGYWAPKAGEIAAATEAAAVPPTPGLAGALTPLVTSKTGRPADVWVGFAEGDDGLTRLMVTWEPTASQPGGKSGPVSLDVERLDGPGGKAVGEPQSLPSSAGVQDSQGVGQFAVRPGTITLRYTARLADGDTADKWTQEVSVPDLARAPLLLGIPVVKRARSALELRQLRADAASAPTPSRQFRRTDRVLVDVSLFGAAASTAEVTADLLNKDGQKLVSLPLPGPADRRVSFELPVNGLANGTYVLRLSGRAGDESAERLEAFQIVP